MKAVWLLSTYWCIWNDFKALTGGYVPRGCDVVFTLRDTTGPFLAPQAPILPPY